MVEMPGSNSFLLTVFVNLVLVICLKVISKGQCIGLLLDHSL